MPPGGQRRRKKEVDPGPDVPPAKVQLLPLSTSPAGDQAAARNTLSSPRSAKGATSKAAAARPAADAPENEDSDRTGSKSRLTSDNNSEGTAAAAESGVPSSSARQPRLGRQFYDVGGEELARALLGRRIVRLVEGRRLSARIVETEAYLGPVDKAAHSYRRQTDRNKAMFMQPGTAYVYNIYGMYCCLNISSRGEGCAVLIRSVEPEEGQEMMTRLRQGSRKSTSTSRVKPRDLGNGPSKLCQSLAITKANVNQRDMVTDGEIWLERGQEVNSGDVVVSARINIAYAEEWTDKPLRFYVRGSPFVSVRDREAERRVSNAGPRSS